MACQDYSNDLKLVFPPINVDTLLVSILKLISKLTLISIYTNTNFRHSVKVSFYFTLNGGVGWENMMQKL